jgi:hypothetical protein
MKMLTKRLNMQEMGILNGNGGEPIVQSERNTDFIVFPA